MLKSFIQNHNKKIAVSLMKVDGVHQTM